MFDLQRICAHRWFIFVLVGLALSACYTLLKIIIIMEQQQLRQYIYNHFSDELENNTATNIVVARLNAQVKEMTYLNKLKTVIKTTNAAQTVFNDHLYSGLNNDTVAIVVRVHKAYNHLLHMVSSLSKAFEFSKFFVIFVHDCNDERINHLIKDIVSFKYMQLYYPYDCNIFLNNYPGQDSNFCVDGYKCVEDAGRRNASLIQQKHLWWWTVNQIFCLDVMINYTKYVVFVDEHSYFVEDLVYLMRLMELSLGVRCPDCIMMNFGGRNSSVSHYDAHTAYITIEPFGFSDITNGIAFDRPTWHKIKASKESYCYFNDYSWVESLKNLIKTAPEKFLVFSTVGSRVIDTSKCEATSQNLTCEFDGIKMNIETFKSLVKRGLYPHKVNVIPKDDAEVEVLQRGGWEDIRDKDLCIFLASKTKSTFGFGL